MVRERVDAPAPPLQAFLGIGSEDAPPPPVSRCHVQGAEAQAILSPIPQRHWGGGLPGYPKIFAPLRMLQSGHRAMPSNHQQAGHLGKEIGLGPSSIPESGLNRKKYLFPTQQL